MKNKKTLICLLGAMLFLVLYGCDGCKKDDPTPKANLEDGLTGYWFKLSSSTFNLIEDADGYIWGIKFDGNGEITVARWDNGAGSITTEASGPAFTVSTAQEGSFSGSDGENDITGTYSLSTVSLSESNYARMNLYSTMLTDEYLPGGHAGDWSVNGYYAKIFNLDASDAEIVNSEEE
jgi:hypothetical protein